MGLNTGYLSTNRGIIKILQIVAGFVICSFLCANWYGGRSCFGEGRLGFASGLNFVIVIINIVVFFINLCNMHIWSLERIYSSICVVLFFVATGLLIWYMIDHNSMNTGWLIATTILIFVVGILFLWDLKILRGEESNYRSPV